MSYLAIARKYRPATFDEMVGQAHVTRTLRNALERGRVHHAFLFTGARGVGKTTAARALAKALNCATGPTADPCGTCTSCVEVAGGRSPDLIEIDGASNNSVDDVRELRDTVQYAPTHGKYKIYLIDEVHMLSKGAFNALLKTLEEPPEHVVFIFATTEPNKIPDTILSRVQRFDFKRIPVNGVVERLREIATAEGVQLADEALRLIARAGEGSMRDAQSLLDQVISASPQGAVTEAQVVEALGLVDRGLLHEALAGLVTGEPGRTLDVVATVYDYGYDLSQFTGELLEVVRNATFLRLSPTARKHVDLAAAEVEALDAVTADVEPEALARLFTALLDVHDLVSKAARPRIVLEMAVARLASVRPVVPLGGLVERLEEMEKRLRGAGAPAAVTGARGRQSDRPTARVVPDPRSDNRRTARPEPPPATPIAIPEAKAPASAPVAPPPATRREPAPRATAADPRPEPPPYDGPSLFTSPEPVAPPVEDPWTRFTAAIAGLPQSSVLTEGTPRLDGARLVVSVASNRAVAQALRLLGQADVVRALRAAYPEGTTLDVTGPVATASDDELKRQALTDPALRRVVDALGAEILRVQPLDDGEST